MESPQRINKRVLGLLGPLLSHRPEPREELGVRAGVLLDVSSEVDATVQNLCVFSKHPLQRHALRVASVTHEDLHRAVL